MKSSLECTKLITQKHQQSLIKDVNQMFNLSFDRIRGQLLYMAAPMSGSKSGVASRIKSIEKA